MIMPYGGKNLEKDLQSSCTVTNGLKSSASVTPSKLGNGLELITPVEEVHALSSVAESLKR